jgi:hypothetical protein
MQSSEDIAKSRGLIWEPGIPCNLQFRMRIVVQVLFWISPHGKASRRVGLMPLSN